jgi:hypothetical protein
MINQFLSRQNGELQMQMLQLPTNDNIRQEKLDKYLGIAHGFTDPFNLFINMTDIEENKDLIYFFSYSMGKKKVVVWGVYDKINDHIEIEAGCQFNSWKYVDYINFWKEMNYKIYTTLSKNKFDEKILRYTDKIEGKKINNETDLRAWKYMIAYFDRNISEDDFYFLFDRLNHDELSYYYEHYLRGDSPLLDFYELFDIPDLSDEEEVDMIINHIQRQIDDYEKHKLNYIDDRSPKSIKYIVLRITELFVDYISRSDYVGNEGVKALPLCPQTIQECDIDDLEDERRPCSIFTFGRSAFSPKDQRFGKIQYEEDLT